MSKISKVAKKNREVELKKPVVNFMGGISYQFNPLDTLKMISASSIFAEPQYYRASGLKDKYYDVPNCTKGYLLFDIPNKTTASELMIKAVNEALDYDFMSTVQWAAELRQDYYMRLNPQLIMVLASVHPNRKQFSLDYPGEFRRLNSKVMNRADEPASQFALYLYLNENKSKIPSVLKRSWCDKLENVSRYEMGKYKNAETGMIDVVRLCHANSPLIDELMTTGTVKVNENELTWERLRSEGKSFKEIISLIKMPHMALLRNLRNIFKELDEGEDKDLAIEILYQLVSGVKNSKQFPFRYYQALRQVQHNQDVHFKSLLIDRLEECIDISLETMPKLKGKTACLSDNSGSAWGTFTSEYGTMQIAEIDNLSAVMTCMCSEEGSVFAFGDELMEFPISKRNGALLQTKQISQEARDNIGMSTENGIWLFFRDAIERKIKYDNIFIYSDMQAGHGELYGTGKSYLIDGDNFAVRSGTYVDVLKLIQEYRSKVNQKVNIFCIQTAGYDNVVIPEYLYRGALLYGWTGKEPMFAQELINQWDNIENRNVTL